MELSSSFEVARSIEDTWAVLTDVERIAPCLPGAKLQEVEGEEHRGVVKVKVGPITAEYKGVATFTEKDDSSHRAVLQAKGRDTRGAGNASAAITAQLAAVDENTTSVSVHTNLTISGKVAQFGRGVMADVSAKLMGQFADNLAAMLEEDDAGADDADAVGADDAGAGAGSDGSGADVASDRGAGTDDSGAGGVPSSAGADDDDVEAVDLVSMAGGAVLKRLVPAVIVLVVVVIVIWARCRRPPKF